MIEKELSQTIDRNKKGLCATKLGMDQISLIQSEVFEQLIILLGDASEDMGIEMPLIHK